MDNSKCRKCGKEFIETDNVVYCPKCEAYHHLECWNKNGGCNNPECEEYVGKKIIARPATTIQSSNFDNQEETTIQAEVSKKEYSKDDSNKKTKKLSKSLITTLVLVGVTIVSFLLMPLSFEVFKAETLGYIFMAIFFVSILSIVIFWSVKLIIFAVKDVQKAQKEILEEALSQNKEKKPMSASRKRVNVISSIGGILAVTFVIVMIVTSNISQDTKVDFEKIYSTHCSSLWAYVASDGSYLKIDTNPNDEDDVGIAYWGANQAIMDVNDALGLPDSLWEEMKETSAVDGRQNRTFESQGVDVSWKYHPDIGLEVIWKHCD